MEGGGEEGVGECEGPCGLFHTRRGGNNARACFVQGVGAPVGFRAQGCGLALGFWI